MQLLGFILFLAMTGILILRPGDLVPELEGWPVYEVTALSCLAVLLPRVVLQLQPARLRENPITACVLGLLLATPLSFLGQENMEGAPEATIAFAKIVVSYLLLTAAIDTFAKLRFYLGWMAVCLAILTTLSLMQYYGLIDNPALAPKADWVMNSETGVNDQVWRLTGAGIFGNPNNLA
jgi:hypothetical protein